VSLEEPHGELVIVHTNVFAPADNPVTPEVGEPVVVTDELPAMTLQDPVPTLGVLPASVAVSEQTSWSGPAFDAVGDAHGSPTAKSLKLVKFEYWVDVPVREYVPPPGALHAPPLFFLNSKRDVFAPPGTSPGRKSTFSL